MVVLGSCYEHDTPPIANESITEVVVTDHRGDAREYIVYIPSTYDEDQEHALVFQLHGGSGNGEKFYTISGWNELAEQHHFIAVYPTSYVYDLKKNGCGNDLITKWNNYNLPKEVCPTAKLRDDSDYFDQVLDELMATYRVDESRVYFAGFSSGSGMTSRLGVELSDRITAIGGLAGFFPQDTTFAPQRIRPLHLMLGTVDEKIAPETSFGDTIPMDFSAVFADPTLRRTIKSYITTFDLDPNYIVTNSSEHILTATFAGKSGNPDHFMKFTLLKNVGHNFPNPANQPGIADMLWDFFEPLEDTTLE